MNDCLCVIGLNCSLHRTVWLLDASQTTIQPVVVGRIELYTWLDRQSSGQILLMVSAATHDGDRGIAPNERRPTGRLTACSADKLAHRPMDTEISIRNSTPPPSLRISSDDERIRHRASTLACAGVELEETDKPHALLFAYSILFSPRMANIGIIYQQIWLQQIIAL